MNPVLSLSGFYKNYTSGKLSKKEFETKIFRYLIDNFDRYHTFNGNRDQWNDFLSWLYPRFGRIIDLYRDRGLSFDAYVAGLVRKAIREYRSREADHYLTESIYWQTKTQEAALFENAPEYPESKKPGSKNEITIPEYIKPKHLLFLLLKSYYFASDELVQQVADTIGMEAGKIQALLDALRERRSGHEEKIRNLQERVHCQYYRFLSYQKKMQAAHPGTAYYETNKDRFERARKRFQRMRTRLEGMRFGASNRMVAEIMGIPKGTVDSGLFSLKSRLYPVPRHKRRRSFFRGD